jgi:hypothetical protein
VAADAHGNIILADTRSSRVRAIATSTGAFYGQAMTAGDIYTLAGNGTAGFSGDGGSAAAAGLRFPSGASADRAGDVLIADTGNNRVRMVAASAGVFFGQAMTAGDIYTIAGPGVWWLGDGRRAASALLNEPTGVAVESNGDVLISDAQDFRIRQVSS